MKRLVSLTLVAVMCLCLFASCGSQEPEETSTIIANYSIKNSEDSKDFIVEVQKLGGAYTELYDENGLYIVFKGGSDEIYDADGSRLSRDDLTVGATLQISYNGKLYKKSPKTIKAYKVTRIG